jgi:X-X-X-Leu-X-X-Gly heptad repeat protein
VANTSQHGPSQRSTEEKHGHGSSQSHKPEGSTAAGVVNTVTEKAKDLAGGASEMASGAKETVQEWTSAAVDAAGQAKHKVQEFATSASHKVENFGEDVTALIRRYPMQALLVGLGAGFLLAQVRRR